MEGLTVLLTDRTLKSLKPDPTKRLEVPDAGLPSLYFVLQPSGAASWAVRYRSPADKRPRKLTLGRFPALGLADARKAARLAILAVAEGRDPAAERTAAEAQAEQATRNTVDAHLSAFLTRHAARNLKRSTAREMARIVEKEIRPIWGKRQIEAIGKRDVIALIDAVTDRGAPVQANRVLAVVRKFFNWLVSRAVIEVSPAAGVKAPAPEASRDRVLSDDEIRWLWEATEGNEPLNLATRLLLLTGQRRGEVAEMVEQELDTPAAVWRLPAGRTKNGEAHTVPLSREALATVAAVPRLDGSPFVFTTTGTTPVSGWSHFKDRLHARMLALAEKERGGPVSIPDWRIHDLRRTAASGMARLGIPVHVVERLLNHVSGTFGGIVGVYQRHDFGEEKRSAAAAWGAFVTALTTGKGGDNVVRLRGAADG